MVGPRSGTSSQYPTLLWRHSQKNKTQKPQKTFFVADSKTCQVFLGFKQHSSAIGWAAMWLVSQLKYPRFFPDLQVRYIHPATNVSVSIYLGTTINKHQIMPQKANHIRIETSELTIRFSGQMPWRIREKKKEKRPDWIVHFNNDGPG